MAEFGAEHIDLSQVQFAPELLACIPAEMAHKYRVLPVFKMTLSLVLRLPTLPI